MPDATEQTVAWLQSVLDRVPSVVRVVYVEYGDAWTPEMLQLSCFDAFGFERLVNGEFDPSNTGHVGDLGSFSWEAGKGLAFVVDEYPSTDWMEVLQRAAQAPEVQQAIALHNVQMLIGEHDGSVYTVTPNAQQVAQVDTAIGGGLS